MTVINIKKYCSSYIIYFVVLLVQVPMGNSWGDISEGVRVEVPNTDSGLPMKVYWIAGIIKLAGTGSDQFLFKMNPSSGRVLLTTACRSATGFKALLRYEGFDGDSTRDFWLNLCVPDIHPVGWCAAGGKPLVPPQSKGRLLLSEGCLRGVLNANLIKCSFFVTVPPLYSPVCSDWPTSESSFSSLHPQSTWLVHPASAALLIIKTQ